MGGEGRATSKENLLLGGGELGQRGSQETEYEDQEALPSDSLYGTTRSTAAGASSRAQMGPPAPQRPFPILSADGNLAHWSSHGYLAKDPKAGDDSLERNEVAASLLSGGGSPLNQDTGGYVVLRRRGDQMTMQPQMPGNNSVWTESLAPKLPRPEDKKYFSVKGLKHFAAQMQEQAESGVTPAQHLAEKYFSVDSSFLQPELKNRLRESLGSATNLAPKTDNKHTDSGGLQHEGAARVGASFVRPYPPPPPPMRPLNNSQQLHSAHQYNTQVTSAPHHNALTANAQPPMLPPYQRPPSPKFLNRNKSGNIANRNWPEVDKRDGPDSSGRLGQTGRTEPDKRGDGRPEEKQDMPDGTSASWHEWTQQLAAYMAWVNSQLRKRAGLTPVKDLRTDLQSGEVLAQLIEIICKYCPRIFV